MSTSYWNRYVQGASVATLQNTPGLMPVGVSGGSLEQDEQAALKALAAMGLSVTPDPDAA